MSRKHLRNICLWQDKILLFDRIEFNEQFRFVDVIYDGVYGDGFGGTAASRLGQCLLNTYVEQTGDWGVAGAAVVFEPAGVCTGEGEFLVVG